MEQLGFELDDSVPLVQDIADSLSTSIQSHKALIDVLTRTLSQTQDILSKEEARLSELSQLLSQTDDVKLKMRMIYEGLPETLDNGPSDPPPLPPHFEELRDPRIEQQQQPQGEKRPAEMGDEEASGKVEVIERENKEEGSSEYVPPPIQKVKLDDSSAVQNNNNNNNGIYGIQQIQLNGFASFGSQMQGQQVQNQQQQQTQPIMSYQQPSLPKF